MKVTFTQFLAEQGIYNEHGLVSRYGVKGADVFLYYSPYSAGMLGGTMVYSPSHKTCPEATSWQDYQNKRFHGNKVESMQKALKWASEKYGIQAWTGSPLKGGAKVPAYVVGAARAAFKEAQMFAKLKG